MSKTGFLFGLSLRELKKNVRINLLVILSLALGMILPLIVFADINVFYWNIRNLYPGISQDVWYCSAQAEHLTQDAYAQIKKELHLDGIGGCEKRSDEVKIGDRLAADALCVVSEDFLDFIKIDLLEGERMAESDPEICMVEESFAAKHGVVVKTGDSLEINGKTYTVRGIFRSMELIGKVLVPLAGFEEKGLRKKNAYILFVQDTTSRGEALLQEQLRERVFLVHTVEAVEAYFERQREICAANSLTILLSIVPVTLFSLVNCILVLYGKVVREKRETAIKTAVGAKREDIFLSCFFEISLLALAAYLLDLFCMPLVVKTVPRELLMMFDFSVYALGFLLLEVMCLVISASLYRKIAKVDAASVLKGE